MRAATKIFNRNPECETDFFPNELLIKKCLSLVYLKPDNSVIGQY